MADVRSLLKSERASRRIAHPYAQYSDTGKLTCSLCDMLVKTESAWKSHIRTPDHARRALRAAEAAAEQNKKKRKAESSDDEADESHKRARADEAEAEAPAEKQESLTEAQPTPQPQKRTVHFAEDTKAPAESPPIVAAPTAAPAAPIMDFDDDPEWLELQRLVADPSSAAQSAYTGATISAAPMSAEEIAAQSREEENTRSQRELREAELEAEKEDAAQALEAEFDEMDELEERVKKLREKREALRVGLLDPAALTTAPAASAGPIASVLSNGKEEPEEDSVEDDEIDEDDDDDEDDVWNFGAD